MTFVVFPCFDVSLCFFLFCYCCFVFCFFFQVTSNLNDCSIGFLWNSLYFLLCRYNTFFNLFQDITEKVVKCICYLPFFSYKLSIIADVPKLLGTFFLLLIISLIPCQTLFGLFLIVFKKVFVMMCYTYFSYFIKKISTGISCSSSFLKHLQPQCIFCKFGCCFFFLNGFQYPFSNPLYFYCFYLYCEVFLLEHVFVGY